MTQKQHFCGIRKEHTDILQMIDKIRIDYRQFLCKEAVSATWGICQHNTLHRPTQRAASKKRPCGITRFPS